MYILKYMLDLGYICFNVPKWKERVKNNIIIYIYVMIISNSLITKCYFIQETIYDFDMMFFHIIS